jgi:hypothetical protein
MNDTTRELGAALGVAVLGSLAASRYAGDLHHLTRSLPVSTAATVQSSLAGALHAAVTLPTGAARTLATSADLAFVDGFHLAVAVGAVLAAFSAVIVSRYLPHQLDVGEPQPDLVVELEPIRQRALSGAPLDLREAPGEFDPDEFGEPAGAPF